MTDSRIATLSDQALVTGDSDSRIATLSTLVLRRSNDLESRIGSLSYQVLIGPETRSGVVHGHRTGLAFGRR